MILLFAVTMNNMIMRNSVEEISVLMYLRMYVSAIYKLIIMIQRLSYEKMDL